jgi:hemerythrin-like metal-binding protein
MSIVAWRNDYSLGMPEIDEQHKALFELINELWEAIVKRVAVENQMLVIEGLERYALAHFAAEETFMRAIKYSKFDDHKKLHDQFVQRVAEEKIRLLAGHGFSLDVIYFLKDWLVDHILVADQDYANFSHKMLRSSTSFLTRFFSSFFGKRRVPDD